MAIKMAKKDKKLELRIKPKAGATDLKAIIRREAEEQPSSVARKQTGIRNNILLPEEKEELNRDQVGSVKKPGITLYNNRDRYSDFIDQQINARQARQNMLAFGDRLRANAISADPLTDREGYIQQVNTRRNNSAYTGKDMRLMSTPQLKLNKAKLEAEDNRAAAEIAAKRKAWENRTAEEKAADNAREQEAADRQGRLAILTMEGLPIGYTMYGRPYTLTDANGMQSLKKVKSKPEDYDETTALDYDRALYDFIYGEGAYDERYERDFDNLDREVSELWDKLENGTIGEDYDQAAENWIKTQKENAGDFGTAKNTGEIEKVQKEIDKRARVQEMEKNAPKLTGENEPVQFQTTWTIGGEGRTLIGSEVDQIAYRIQYPMQSLSSAGEVLAGNGIAEADLSDPQRKANMHPSNFMNDEQKDTFWAYYKSGDKEGALAYYKGLESTYLMPMYNQAQEELVTKMTQNEWGPVMKAQRWWTQPIAGIRGVEGAALALLGVDEGKNPDSPLYKLTKENQQIQTEWANQWADTAAKVFGGGENGTAATWARRLNGITLSMWDNIEGMLIGAGVGGAVAGNTAGALARGTVQFIMSSEAAANTMVEKLDDGMDPTLAALYAIGDGAIEWVTENMGFDALMNPNVKELLGNKGQFIKYMAKNFGSEGGEEIASDVLGTIFDETVSLITGNDSELTQRYKELTKNHQYTDAQAKAIIAREYGEKLGESFVAADSAAFS